MLKIKDDNGQQVVMTNAVQTEYDEAINGYVVRMPEYISFNLLKAWLCEFSEALNSSSSDPKIALLIDTNQHNFESVQCLKLLREFFTNNPVLVSHEVKAAFVQPRQYVEPCVKSDSEAYFDNFDAAYNWLSEQSRGG